MKKYIILILIAVISGCKKPDNVTIDQVISGLTISNKAPNADGTTIVYISAQLNTKADADKRSIIFESSAGLFNKANDTLITQPATFVNGALVATVALKVPITAGEIYISAKPATATQYKDFILKDSINAVRSIPATLMLTPSSFGIKSNYGNEVALTATLKNSLNNNVSTGTKVLFEDYYPGGQPVNGQFRALRDTTDATSTATAAFSFGAITGPTTFYIKCTYLDHGGKTAIKDSCLITITQ